MTKTHLPAPGRASGSFGTTLCGRGSRFATGDHALIRRLAQQARREGDASHYCAGCLARV